MKTQESKISPEMARLLTKWYDNSKRPLPWRDTGDPYDVWISEIMLQQTRIEAVRERFTKFRMELPGIPALAVCPDDKLMRLWEGMGYYRRAANLKRCAEVLVSDFGGKLPADYNELKKLPGIGDYTAGAIASIAFHIPVPAVDGNVLRVLARVTGCEKDVKNTATRKLLTASLTDVYEACRAYSPETDASGQEIDPASFNQGLMELGETICLPKGTPHCARCPWNFLCSAASDGSWDRIPVRTGNKSRKIVRRTLFILRDEEHFLVHKRQDDGLLAGLYEFPGVDGSLSQQAAKELLSEQGLLPRKISRLQDSRHIFSHLEWRMRAYEVMVTDLQDLNAIKNGGQDRTWLAADREELAQLAIPSAFQSYLKYFSLRSEDQSG